MALPAEHPSTQLFRSYLRINTMQPSPDYEQAVSFLQAQATTIGLSYRVGPRTFGDQNNRNMQWKSFCR